MLDEGSGLERRKRPDTKTMIACAGHTLEYLSPYSSDLNPIEHKWAQAKAIKDLCTTA